MLRKACGRAIILPTIQSGIVFELITSTSYWQIGINSNCGINSPSRIKRSANPKPHWLICAQKVIVNNFHKSFVRNKGLAKLPEIFLKRFELYDPIFGIHYDIYHSKIWLFRRTYESNLRIFYPNFIT